MSEESQSVQNNPVRKQLTDTITYFVAATIISDKQFPRKGYLPRPSAPPLRSQGHYVLLDYRLLVRIIWQVIDEIKMSAKKIYKRIPIRSIVMGGIVAVILFIFSVANQAEISGALFLALIGGAIGVFLSLQNARFKLLLKEVAAIRAKVIKKLIAGDWSPVQSGEMVEKIEKELGKIEIGDGVLGGDQIPILVISRDQHPFPGYGHLQAENVFVCRPQKTTSVNSTPDDGFETIQNNIVSAVSKFPVGDMSCGDILVVHGGSLPIDSVWLNENKSPKLWLDRRVLEKFSTIDERVSVRRFFAVQTLFSEYGTVATFFIRPFMAGNSLCCQVAFSTIGPLINGVEYFQKKLLKYEQEEKNGFNIKPPVQKRKNKDVSPSTKLIQDVRRLAELGDDFQSRLINYQEIKELDPLYEEDDKEYKKEFKQLVEKSTVWLGQLIITPNWRETYSMTFTNDFFGKTEELASVRTLYDQISRTILDTFELLGYDISDYRDDEGNYSIHAEKIEQLVVGEKIQIADKKEEGQADTRQSQ